MYKKFPKLYFLIFYLYFCATLLLVGCASPIQSYTPNYTNSKKNIGMVYSLPKGQIQLTASRKMVSGNDLTAAQKVATDAAVVLAMDTKALAEAKTEFDTALGALGHATSLIKDDMKKKSDMAKAVFDFLAIKVAAETKSAAAADENSRNLAGKVGKWTESISLLQLASVPDAQHRFVAYLNHNFTRDDTMKISVIGGMLSTTTATSTDQTANIILNLVSAKAAFSQPLSFFSTKKDFQLLDPKPNESCEGYSFSYIFDPSDFQDVQEVLKKLKDVKSTATLNFDNFSDNMINGTKELPLPIHVSEVPGGLVYRTPLAIRIDILPIKKTSDPNLVKTCEVEGLVVATSYVIIVPDSRTEFVLASSAGAFTKTTFDFTFKDGTPTDYSIGQPSELSGIASLPLDIAKAIVSVPASIIKLRVDYDSQANALVDAQTASLKAQLEQIKAQQALDSVTKQKNANVGN